MVSLHPLDSSFKQTCQALVMTRDCKVFEPGILLFRSGVFLAVTSKESAPRKMSLA